MSLNPFHEPEKQRKLDLPEPITPDTIARLINAAAKQRAHGQRNAALISLMYQYGLRVQEAIALTWNQLDLNHGTINIVRAKENTSSIHPLGGQELQLLRQLKQAHPNSHYVFQSEAEEPLTQFRIQGIIAGAGARAGLSFRVNPHMLRFAAAHRSQPAS